MMIKRRQPLLQQEEIVLESGFEKKKSSRCYNRRREEDDDWFLKLGFFIGPDSIWAFVWKYNEVIIANLTCLTPFKKNLQS